MTRTAALVAASALFAAPALAASYTAKPLAAPSASKNAGKSIGWSCSAGTCKGNTESSRPLVICQDLAKRVGRLESFSADGRQLSATDLDKCNARAGAPTALARAN